MSSQIYEIETYSEKRIIEIKNFYGFENIPEPSKNTTFNIVFITADDKIVFGKRKDSYYFDILHRLTIKKKEVSNTTLRYFCCLFQNLNIDEKFYILKGIPKDSRYKNIIKFISTHFGNFLEYLKKNNKIKDIDKIMLLNCNDNNKLTKYHYFTKLYIDDNINKYFNIIDYKDINNRTKKINKTLVLPGGKPINKESIIDTIKRETKEELNINLNNIDVSKTYYADTTIYDKIVYKTFHDITFIANIPLTSYDILLYFKPNREVSDVYFININDINYKKLLILAQCILIM
ncbi:ORF MSV150 putative NTP pyrophosphohydrolase mutT motif homolog (vaccinia D10R), similar to SW:P32817 [Melanoplus sanguinipes entomopoxvirus]|uniref:ORF MSV150 putative NTP pyrophosphohydrolase mutT motif homolog (Vaccinia D10R), similar to SW:P32817 n=1 Tax=Melanoplus sanguinipes entomopoxvirus TaxID=83191 RepID=Q9YVU2_MSEPV|nr:ORF MSV150 putative NTP pyrophosphohydrolase mutT motif homolog (vaccinia D10R), similar to SW:P32817 [Melanoplus sanguinipes entomopoxvirus]AAC97785.1 ORF MSV150 putative NTP pyrophosphohydrolase mutT motif homolog (vaccinia D10R), similar to SW:P32817 [Melanoplus sanguinipes entomopoxvirus 'O']